MMYHSIKVDMLPLKKGEVIVRMFPTEEDDSKKIKLVWV